MQMLTHVREKLVFIEKQNKLYAAELGENEGRIVEMRNALTRAKLDREHTRKEKILLQQQQGFATSEQLIVDFEKTKLTVDSVQGEIRDLRQRYQVMAKKLGMPLDASTGFVVSSPARRSGSQTSLSLEVPVRAGGSMSMLSSSASVGAGAGGLFSPTPNKLSPLRRGSPVANLRKSQQESPYPMATMTPMRTTTSTGSSYMKKLPPLTPNK